MTVKKQRKYVKEIKKYNPTKEKNDMKILYHGWGCTHDIFRMKLKAYHIHISKDDSINFFHYLDNIDNIRERKIGSTTFGNLYDIAIKEQLINNLHDGGYWNTSDKLVLSTDDYYNLNYKDKSRWKQKKDQTKDRNRQRLSKLDC